MRIPTSCNSIFVFLFLALAASVASAQESSNAGASGSESFEATQDVKPAVSKKKAKTVQSLPSKTEADKVEAARREADTKEDTKDTDSVKIPSTEPDPTATPLVVTNSAFSSETAPTTKTSVLAPSIDGTKELPPVAVDAKKSEKVAVKSSSLKETAPAKSSTKTEPVKTQPVKVVEKTSTELNVSAVSEESSSIIDTNETVAWGALSHRRNPVWFTQTIGFLYSKWSKLNPGLNNGSFTTSFYVAQEVMPAIEFGLGMNWIRGTGANGATDDIRNAFELRANGRFRLSQGVISPHAALDLAYGSYKAWDAVSSTANQVTYDKSAGGALLGLSPGLGASARIFGRSRIDLTAQYQFYFGKTARYVGGLTMVGSYALGF